MPMALGHEAAGEVLEAGSPDSALSSGDHVVLAFVPACGECSFCRQGRPALCERTLKGSYLGSCVPSRDIPRFIEMYEAGFLPVDGLLSHRLTPDQINEGFDRLASGEAVRQVVLFG